jgi:hypothetical protein
MISVKHSVSLAAKAFFKSNEKKKRITITNAFSLLLLTNRNAL